MAIGISGSNGGITKKYNKLISGELSKLNQPLEVSYFINNVCNLKCKHCYVGYKNQHQNLKTEDWINTFESLIKLGAKTFGNVGKEPLLDWHLTKELLQYFKYKRDEDKAIRFGFVTNGLLMDSDIISELSQIQPDYIDISLDGSESSHEQIRGKGTYQKLLHNFTLLSETNLAEKIFISFTLNKLNKETLSDVIEIVNQYGLTNLLISPYVTLKEDDELYLSDEELVNTVSEILNEKAIFFSNYENLNIYIKSDYTTSKSVMMKFKETGIINENELLIDDYGVIFNKYHFGTNIVYFNYLPYDNTFSQAIRISHDGYVSGCLDMFYENYTEKAIGNIKESKINEILSRANELVY